MNNTSEVSLHLSKEDSIGYFPLSNRTANALKRSGIKTVREVVVLVESGMIENIRGLGKKCILELEDCLDNVKIKGEFESESVEGATLRIGQLKLSKRSFNALQNAGVQTVTEVIRLVESGAIRNIRGLGRNCISEIQDKLTKIEINNSNGVNVNPDASTSLMNVDVISEHLSKEDSIGKLHLTNRSTYALKRSGIKTVGEIVYLVESGMIDSIRGLGEKCILEIENCLDHHLKIGEKLKLESVEGATLRIGQLKLSKRSFNALQNAGVQTVAEVVRLVESGEIRNIRGLGRNCISEIQDKLTKIEINDSNKVNVNPDAAASLMNADVISDRVIRWQSHLIAKQLSIELLHEHAKVADRSVKDWLTEIETVENNEVYEALATILSSSLNICDELEFLINSIATQHCMTILLSRYGYNKKTLGQIGQEIGTTRERVRQIENELKHNMSSVVRAIVCAESIGDFKTIPTLLRIQSALLIARDIGLDINYQQWTQRIRSSGLVGNWKTQDFASKDPVEIMIAICNVIDECKIPCLQIPKCLQYALQLANAGMPNAHARILHLCETLPIEVKRLINRHMKHSGSVYVRWLSQEIERELEETKDILQGLGYKMLSKDWFIPKVLKDVRRISKNDVFHQGLHKMFYYCGPLSIDDVCSGLRHVLSRTKFPVPPPDVMNDIVRIHGYKYDRELYYWDGDYDASLNGSENVIMNCMEQIGPVVHHSELVHAFMEVNLSLSALSATLNYSPLFVKVESALYKMRGKSISYQNIMRAKLSGNRQFLNPEIEYDTDGNVIVSFTVSANVIAVGTVSCEHFPNLSGEDWTCYIQGERVGKLSLTENEFRHLKKPFEVLNCQPGNRLMLIFNTWNRTVTIEKVGTNAKQ